MRPQLRALLSIVAALALVAPARAAPLLTDEELKANRRGVSLSGLGTGVAMDVAVTRDRLYLLDQDGGNGDQLHVIDRASGQPLAHVALGAHGAAAVTAAGDGLWVLSRGRDVFLRRLDPAGNMLETRAMASLPPGKIYGLAVSDAGFFFTTFDGTRSHLQLLPRAGGDVREVAVLEAKIDALVVSGDGLVASCEHEETFGGNWLAFFTRDGRYQGRLRSPGAMGLDAEGNALLLMQQHGADATLTWAYPDLARGVLVMPGTPHHVRLVDRIGHTGGGRFAIREFLALPIDRDFQRIRHLVARPAPVNVVTDRDGNTWGEFYVEGSDPVNLQLDFDIATARALWTIDPDAAPPIESFPPEVRATSLAETSAFDFSSPPVQQLIARVPRAPSLAGLLVGAQNVVDDALTVHGASGPETKASLFLAGGVGRCYAHTLSFAAVARGLGLPVRAMGGLLLHTSNGVDDNAESNAHTWNEAYFPGQGWVAIDTLVDDDPDGHHSLRGFGNVVDSYVLTFAGAYADADDRYQFAGRSWFRHRSTRNLDRENPAALTFDGIDVEVSDLPTW